MARRMPEQDDSKREAPISYRPPKDLRAEFDKRVLDSGLSTSAFITKSIFDRDPPRRSRRPSIDHKAVAEILAAMVPVRDELHAIAMLLVARGVDPIVIEEACRPLIEIRALCFKALGRKP